MMIRFVGIFMVFQLAWIQPELGARPAAAQEINKAARPIDFNRDIRPILSDKCFQCHGPDANERQADLRLDLEESLFADRGGHAAFVAGAPDKSEAIRRVLSDVEYERMPPPDSTLSLSADEKQLLVDWVRQGAEWSQHWSFVAPEPQTLPLVKDSAWPMNDIDLFVLAKLEEKGLHPSAVADRTTLIRRVTLDLTGIPPTPQEVDEFLADTSDKAYEKLVDRLLASPRYGQRMAWPWLDAARYADTDGFQGDPTRDMWPWRDWLVNALNENMPFDQFTIEMLAGDLLPDARIDQMIASGFNRNHLYNGEGGRIPEETRTENVFDRTETTATVWLGLTATCARCHDHKFDPLAQKEYYQLYAFFNDTSESGAGGGGKAGPTISYLTPERMAEVHNLDAQIAAITQRMNAPDPKLDAEQAAWLSETSTKLRKLQATAPIQETELGDWWVVGTIPPPDDKADAIFAYDFGPESRVDLEAKFASVLDGKETRWQKRPEFVDGQVHALPGDTGVTYFYREFDVIGERAFSLGLGSDDGIRVWLNGDLQHEVNLTRVAQANQDEIELTLPQGKNRLLIKVVNTGGASGFYFQKKSEAVYGLPIKIAQSLAANEDAASKRDLTARLREIFRVRHSDTWRDLDEQRKQLTQQKKDINATAARVMVMDTLPADKRRTTHILERGSYEKPLAEVSAGTPSFLPALEDGEQPDRLSLAKWIVDERNPLTARVTVNRYWQEFFGSGLVATSEDFGRQGELPSHAELLDWLAIEFVRSGWDVKAIHKQIVMSATYRQSSHATGEESSYINDPQNRLLSRGPRHRWPSWMLRDQALAVSGLLVEKTGGPAVNSYQPDGVWAEATFGQIRYQQGSGEDLYRRSLYTFWRRIVGPTVFFDAGKRQTCTVRPSVTNSPLHALTTLNETTFVEASRVMAERVMKEVETTETDGDGNEIAKDLLEQRLTFAFRLAAVRKPTPAELHLLTRRWEKLVEHFVANKESAEELLSVGESPHDASLPQAEHAAYTAICSLILNLDEVLSKE